MSAEQVIYNIFNYLMAVAITTALQIFILLGPGLVLAFIMHGISSLIRRRLYQIMGAKRYPVLLGWLGIMIHETGHALFAILFGHRILKVKLFNRKAEHGILGYVASQYNPKSYYQRIGNLFVSVGPIVLGALAVYIASLLLLGPEVFRPMNAVTVNSDALGSLQAWGTLGMDILNNAEPVLSSIFSTERLRDWQFYAFLYITLSIGSAMALSQPDFELTKIGAAALVKFLAIFNLVTLWMGSFATLLFATLSQAYSRFYIVMIFTIIINAIFALILFPLGIPFEGIR